MSKEIPLQNGMFAIVDYEDYEKVNEHNWFLTKSGSVTSYIMKNQVVTLGRFILDVDDKTKNVVNINDNYLDYRRNNLKITTKQEAVTRSRGHRNTSSKYKGVFWHTSGGKWRAAITKDGKKKWLGGFRNEDDAALAYNKAARELFGEGCYLNVIGTNNNSQDIPIDNNIVKRKRKDAKSKYKGVSWWETRGIWVAKMQKDKKPLHLGYFKTEIEAAKVYDQKAKELFGDKAILNFPEMKEEYSHA